MMLHPAVQQHVLRCTVQTRWISSQFHKRRDRSGHERRAMTQRYDDISQELSGEIKGTIILIV